MSESTELATITPEAASTSSMAPSNLTEAIALANLMAGARMVPECLQNRPADCLLVIEQAARWGMSPFAVAQCAFPVSGKLGYEGKLVAAVINSRGDLVKRLSYDYTGEGDSRSVTVSGQLRGEENSRTVTVAFKDARTRNDCWKTQPDQQLAYHGVRVWARRHMPELMLGVYSPEEMTGQEYTPPPRGQNTAAMTAAAEAWAEVSETPSDIIDEDILDQVDVFDATTGEIVRRAPRATTNQIARIHGLLDKLGHHMHLTKAGKVDKDGHLLEEGSRVELGKYRKKLLEKFSKEHTNELATFEAEWVITWLMKVWQKLDEKLDRGNDAVAANDKPTEEASS